MIFIRMFMSYKDTIWLYIFFYPYIEIFFFPIRSFVTVLYLLRQQIV